MKHLSWSEDREAIVDNLNEEYNDRCQERGKGQACIWYILHVFRSILPFLSFELKWSFFMIKNYLKITLRIIRKQKITSFINLAGLVIGFSCFLLIFAYVRYERSYDTFHEKAGRIYRVITQDLKNTTEDKNTRATSNAALAPSLMEEFPDIEAATRFNSKSRLLFSYGDKHLYQEGIFTDEHFFDVFSFTLREGDAHHTLENPASIIITPQMAETFFGNHNPIGQTLRSPLGDLTIIGVTDPLPDNSHIRFDWLISFRQIKSRILEGSNSNPQFFWAGALGYYTYCTLKDGADTKALEEKITASQNKKYLDFGWDHMTYRFHLQPLTHIHLRSHLSSEFSINNSNDLIVLFSVIAVFILLIACINAMNLTSAQTVKRMKEIGIRKVVGGQRRQIFRQFIGESILMSFFSLITALGITRLLLSAFNRLIERNIHPAEFFNGPIILTMALAFVLCGLLTGLYPAAACSSHQPFSLMNNRRTGAVVGGTRLKNLLVTFQFSITITLMISSVVMFLQIQYIHKKPLGYNREYVVVTRMADSVGTQGIDAFTKRVLQHPSVLNVTTSDALPTRINNTWGGGRPQSDDEAIVGFPTELVWIDQRFVDFYAMDILKGRAFSDAHKTDASNAILVNETFAKKLQVNNPIGKSLKLFGNWERNIVGIVKDFHFQSMHLEIKPLILFCRPLNRWIQIRIGSEHVPETMAFLRQTYRTITNGRPFESFFLDDNFNRMYASEQKLGHMLIVFSGLAIIIACLGIFGLASHTAEKRTKEIGIRKVLGASGGGIFIMISGTFITWIVLANLIAWPAAFFAMKRWLQAFAYRIDLSIWPFLLSGAAALLIALLTVSYQTIRAAAADPVDSLRYE